MGVLPSGAPWRRRSWGVGRRRSWGAGKVALTPGEPQGDAPAVCFQYKVLSVLPGSGMGIAVSTPSTQKVKVLAGAPEVGVGQGWGSACVAWSHVSLACVDSRLRLFAPSRQPLVFGAMVHRDEAFETIFNQYMKITSAAAAGSDS